MSQGTRCDESNFHFLRQKDEEKNKSERVNARFSWSAARGRKIITEKKIKDITLLRLKRVAKNTRPDCK